MSKPDQDQVSSSRRFISLVELACLIVLVVAPMSASAREARLDGWGNYRFGMTIEQARAVRGISWTNPKPGEVFGSRFVEMESLSPVQSDGYSFNVSVYFGFVTTPARPRLNSIVLTHPGTQQSLPACQTDFESLLQALERRHGGLSPPPQQTGSFDPFDIAPRTVEERDLPGGSSRFAIKTPEQDRVPQAYVLKAVRNIDTMRLSLEAQYGTFGTQPNQLCDIYLRFDAN